MPTRAPAPWLKAPPAPVEQPARRLWRARYATALLVSFLYQAGCSDGAPDDPARNGPCAGVTCHDHGECVVRDDEPHCRCEEGFRPDGLACLELDEEAPCLGVTCSSHGSCRIHHGSPLCICDAGYQRDETALSCFASDEPAAFEVTDLALGESVVVAGLDTMLSDIFRTPTGTLIVTTHGTSGEGHVQLARSKDLGRSWTITTIQNTGVECHLQRAHSGDDDRSWDIMTLEHTDQPVYMGRLFAIDASTVGLSVGEGSATPYDGYIRYSRDDGETFAARWIDVSNMPEDRGEPQISVSHLHRRAA